MARADLGFLNRMVGGSTLSGDRRAMRNEGRGGGRGPLLLAPE